MARCSSGAFASPSGKPRRYGTARARGGRTLRVISGSKVIDAVAMPARSISACTRPTVWWHVGHTGTRSATSTSSSRRIPTTSGAVFATRRPGAVIEPMSET